VTTVLEGIRAAVSDGTTVMHSQGCDAACTSTKGFADATAKNADTVVLVVGESATMSGEAASRSSTDLPGKQLALIKEIDRTGRLYAVALMNGRPLTIEWLHDLAPTVLEALFPGTEAGHAVADVLFGDVNPGGKLPVNFPRNVGQIPLALDAGDTTTSPSSSTVTTSAFWNLARSNLATRRVGVGQLRGRAEGHVHRNRGNADRHAVRPSCPSSVCGSVQASRHAGADTTATGDRREARTMPPRGRPAWPSISGEDHVTRRRPHSSLRQPGLRATAPTDRVDRDCEQ
jgi:hypothetical protein